MVNQGTGIMLNFTSDQWVIVGLIFLLGLLVGGFLFSGGGRKWKQRYNTEIDRRRELETTHAEREKAWREQDSLRAAALKERERASVVTPVAAATSVEEERRIGADRRTVADRRDTNNDGIVDADEAARAKPAGFMDRVLGRDVDRDGDGIPDRKE